MGLGAFVSHISSFGLEKEMSFEVKASGVGVGVHRPACVAVETLPSFSGAVWSAMTVIKPFGVSRLSTFWGF